MLRRRSPPPTPRAHKHMNPSVTRNDLLATMPFWPAWAKSAWSLLGQPTATLMAKLWTDPTAIFRTARMIPDPWQERILRSQADKIMLLAARQVGKSIVCSALALRSMLLEAPALVLVVSPSDRQSGEFVR